MKKVKHDPVAARYGTQYELPAAKRSNRKIALIVLGVFLSLILVVGIFGALYLNSLMNLIDHEEVTGNPSLQASDLVEPEETVDQPDDTPDASEAEQEQVDTSANISVMSDPNVYNILLIGTDNRGNEVNGRSDAMIILSINKETQKMHLISLQRQLYVSIPEHGFSMLNHSFSFGGPKLLLKTIEDNFRVKIDDYVIINFSGFTSAIDIVGGVDMSLTSKEAETLNAELGTALQAGSNRLNGSLALAYSRIRHIDSDYQRTSRQRKVIQALIGKMMKLNPIELDKTARKLLPLIKTNLNGTEMLSLAIKSLDYKDYPISQLMLPIAGTHKTIIVNKAQMIKFDFAKNVEALQTMMFKD